MLRRNILVQLEPIGNGFNFLRDVWNYFDPERKLDIGPAHQVFAIVIIVCINCVTGIDNKLEESENISVQLPVSKVVDQSV